MKRGENICLTLQYTGKTVALTDRCIDAIRLGFKKFMEREVPVSAIRRRAAHDLATRLRAQATADLRELFGDAHKPIVDHLQVEILRGGFLP